MAITKNQLKSIVKECLVEILAEGMGSSTKGSIVEAGQRLQQQQHQGPKNHVPISTVMQQNASKTRLDVARSLKETIIKESGGNPVMMDIFADTAAKTLPTMLENDRTKMAAAPVGAIERAVSAHAPEELFGEEVASKWAALAFAEPPNKLR